MTAVYKEERFLAARWKNQSDPMKENNITDIGVEVRADSRTNGFLFLQYEFSNEKECLSEIEAAKKNSL